MTGTYQTNSKKLWADFRAEYRERILPGLAARSGPQIETSLNHFERIVKPVRVFAISTAHVDQFTAARRQEPGQKRGSVISPASVNHDLRHVKAALSVAVEWGYLKQLPRFRMEREPRRLPTYVSAEHFAAIYAACETARMPERLPFPPADWWRGLLAFAYTTGWRISDLLGLRREDLDLEAGYAVTRFEDNKGKRDDRVKLHPVLVEHLKGLQAFTPTVFPWNHDRRTLDPEFHRIQRAAGINLPCPERHGHTPACHVYGFHDLRRAFATYNAERLGADALQTLMRHKSYQTTQLYINMARQMDDAALAIYIPDVLRKKAAGEG
jgi:integrase